jgi:hypothetical protein
MKRLREMFRLTRAEQRVVILVIIALLAIAIVRKHRETGKVPLVEPSPGPSVIEKN